MENTLENATKFFDEYTRHYRDNNPNVVLNLPEVLVEYADELFITNTELNKRLYDTTRP